MIQLDWSIFFQRGWANNHQLGEFSDKYKELEKQDPLLKENPRRWVMFPLQYPEVWEMYKKHEASFWTAEEIDLAQDNKDWISLSETWWWQLKYFLFSSLPGERIQFDSYFSGGLKPPTRKVSSILSSMSWHSLQLLMVSSWRIWRNSFLPKYRSQKPGLFMDSKLLWKTSILRPIPCSLSSTSKIPRRRMILSNSKKSLAGGVLLMFLDLVLGIWVDMYTYIYIYIILTWNY